MSPDSKHDQKKTPDCSSSRLASFSVGRGKSELTEVLNVHIILYYCIYI